MRLFRRIYLDYASLTPIDSRVLREMKRFSAHKFANPSSIYKEGVAAKKLLDEGRKIVAGFLNAHPDEIVFTSGGTEANGLVLEGCGRAVRRSGNEKPHLIISAIEHSSIMEVANMLEKHGVEVTRLSVNKSGIISLDELKKSLRTETYMVSIMTVNNEIGNIQPIREIVKVIRNYRARLASKYPLFHTDAAQAALYFELNVEKLGIDLLTLDGGKVYGPRGIGALFVRRGIPIEPTIHGGGQEKGLRSGTENIPAIMGFAKSLSLAKAVRDDETIRIAALKDKFLKGLIEMKKGIMATAEIEDHNSRASKDEISAPHILNVTIPGIDNEVFVLRLDASGIACSTKSSCLRDQDESYVLGAIGADSRTSVRFSFGRWTKKSDIRRALNAISRVLEV